MRVIFFKQLFVGLILVVLVVCIGRKPSNTRDWEVGYETLPGVSVNGDLVSIKNVRDWRYGAITTVLNAPFQIISKNYFSRTYDSNDLIQVWFLVEPFSRWQAIAHTYFVFDFEDENGNIDSVSLSVEARREKGEKYNATAGLLRKYELMYTWGTEKDFTGRRVLVDEKQVYMYPLAISSESAQKLFLGVAGETEALEQNPRFYNTLTSNCTNNLARHARQVKKDALPIYSLAILPGYADKMLYRLGYIENNGTLAEMKNRYAVNEIVKKAYVKESFVAQIRNYFATP